MGLFSRSLFLATLSTVWSVSSAAPGYVSCWTSYILSGFSIIDFAHYNRWFDEDSVMELAQAGTYEGAGSVEEYARFFAGDMPHWAGVGFFDRTLLLKDEDDGAQEGECVMLMTVASPLATNPETAIPSAFSMSFLFKVYYTPKPFLNGITVRRANVYVTPEAVTHIFDMMGTSLTSEWTCSMMQKECSETFAWNGFSSVADCVDKMQKLDNYGAGTVDLSGNVRGCKTLHATFARSNPMHCAHTSIKPQEDPSGKTKCQTTSNVDPSALFTDNDISFFENRSVQLGLGIEGLHVCDCANLLPLQELPHCTFCDRI